MYSERGSYGMNRGGNSYGDRNGSSDYRSIANYEDDRRSYGNYGSQDGRGRRSESQDGRGSRSGSRSRSRSRSGSRSESRSESRNGSRSGSRSGSRNTLYQGGEDGRNQNSWNKFEREHQGEFSREQMRKAYEDKMRMNGMMSRLSLGSRTRSKSPQRMFDGRSQNSWNKFEREHSGEFNKEEMREAYEDRMGGALAFGQGLRQGSRSRSPQRFGQGLIQGSRSRSPQRFGQESIQGTRSRSPQRFGSAFGQGSIQATRSRSPQRFGMQEGGLSWNEFRSENKGRYSREELSEAYAQQKEM